MGARKRLYSVKIDCLQLNRLYSLQKEANSSNFSSQFCFDSKQQNGTICSKPNIIRYVKTNAVMKQWATISLARVRMSETTPSSSALSYSNRSMSITTLLSMQAFIQSRSPLKLCTSVSISSAASKISPNPLTNRLETTISVTGVKMKVNIYENRGTTRSMTRVTAAVSLNH